MDKTIKQIQQLKFCFFPILAETIKNVIYWLEKPLTWILILIRKKNLYIYINDRFDQNMRYFLSWALYYDEPNNNKTERKKYATIVLFLCVSFHIHQALILNAILYSIHLYIQWQQKHKNSYFNSVFACSCKFLYSPNIASERETMRQTKPKNCTIIHGYIMFI